MKLQLDGGKKACANVCYVSDLLPSRKIYMYEPFLDSKVPQRSCNFAAKKMHDPSASSVEIQQACTHNVFRSLDAVFQVALLSGTSDFLFATCVSKHTVSMCCLYHLRLHGDISVGKKLASRKGKNIYSSKCLLLVFRKSMRSETCQRSWGT